MTNIERMAKEAGMVAVFDRMLGPYITDNEQLAKFAARVADDLAQLCKTMPNPDYSGYGNDGEDYAAAIRAKYPMHNPPEAK